MKELLELKKWVDEQKRVCQDGYAEAMDEEAKIMYSCENMAFGLVIMKIDKMLQNYETSV